MARWMLIASTLLISKFAVLAQVGEFEHAPGATYAFWKEIALGPVSSSSGSAEIVPDASTSDVNLAQDVLVDVLHLNASSLDATRNCYDQCLRAFYDGQFELRSCEDFIDDYHVQSCMCHFEEVLNPIANCHEECLPQEIMWPLSGTANVTARCQKIQETSWKLRLLLKEANGSLVKLFVPVMVSALPAVMLAFLLG